MDRDRDRVLDPPWDPSPTRIVVSISFSSSSSREEEPGLETVSASSPMDLLSNVAALLRTAAEKLISYVLSELITKL